MCAGDRESLTVLGWVPRAMHPGAQRDGSQGSRHVPQVPPQNLRLSWSLKGILTSPAAQGGPRGLTPNCRFPEARSRGRSQDNPCERRRRKLFLKIRVEHPAGFPGWEWQFDGPGAAKEHCLELEREGQLAGLSPCVPRAVRFKVVGGRKLRKHPYSP